VQHEARHTLAEYQRHLELYGPGCLVETAAADLAERELGELRALIDSTERVSRFRNGTWHAHRPEAVRPCVECGLDLPPAARRNMERHAHCKSRAKRRRAAGTGASIRAI
jgi:hypothetical protein